MKKNFVARTTHSKTAALAKVEQIINSGQLLEVKSEKQEPSLKNLYNKDGDICYEIEGYAPRINSPFMKSKSLHDRY
ncbi:hypothetical protein [Bacillus licheniformis]|uniref:hypothetical protein n=1 Tax=Bacillus licheniformis TaxID=1402 RepID=UPI0005CEC18F|nr:hypothetical protein [Bacillus licheniformis]PAC96973.1 hypothetical protein CHH89_19780 [Bacillus licheniformis]PAE47531.1 hypothetical protein CHH94_09465 [Bacillus licheniformis]QAW38391.1 hypothetical protein ETK49_14345 [Bacillus licheniformis]